MLDEADGAWRGEDDGGSLGRLGVQRARHGRTDDISTRDVCYQLLLSPDVLRIFVNFYRFLGSIWNSSSHDNPFCGASHGLARLLPRNASIRYSWILRAIIQSRRHSWNATFDQMLSQSCVRASVRARVCVWYAITKEVYP